MWDIHANILVIHINSSIMAGEIIGYSMKGWVLDTSCFCSKYLKMIFSSKSNLVQQGDDMCIFFNTTTLGWAHRSHGNTVLKGSMFLVMDGLWPKVQDMLKEQVVDVRKA